MSNLINLLHHIILCLLYFLYPLFNLPLFYLFTTIYIIRIHFRLFSTFKCIKSHLLYYFCIIDGFALFHLDLIESLDKGLFKSCHKATLYDTHLVSKRYTTATCQVTRISKYQFTDFLASQLCVYVGQLSKIVICIIFNPVMRNWCFNHALMYP